MSKCKITGKVLAIQLGREDTQIVLMGKGAEILHTVKVQTPDGAVEDGMIRNPEAVRTMLKTALKEEPAFKRVRQAVFTLCTSQVISETVTTPELPDAKLEKLLTANVDMYFPVDMHDYQLVWQRIGPVVKENGLKELAVQLWAVPTSMLARYYSVANACGLSVVAVDYCGHSIATAVGASFSGKAKASKKLSLNMEIGRSKKKAEPEAQEKSAQNPDTDLFLTMEKDLLGMTFVQKGTVVFQRFIRCGSDPAYQLGELAMMVDYFSTMDVGRGSTVSAIPCGALCNNRALMSEVEDALGMMLAAYPADHDPRFVLAVGAVLTTLDFGVPALNKPGKARKDLQASLWQYLLILAGGLALVAVVMMLLSSRIVWKSDIGRLKSMQQTLTIQAQKTAGFADNYKAYASKYDSYSADWDTVFASLQTYNDNLVLVIEELEELLPKSSSVTDFSEGNGDRNIELFTPNNGVFSPSQYFQTHSSSIAITGLQIAPDGMNIQFACENKEEAAYLIMALREMQYADLLGITDLQGGGSGPATSYGSGTEKAPTEGGSSNDNAITNLVKNELSKEELTALAGSLTGDEIKAMEKAYGAAPSNSLGLEEYKTINNPSFEQRKNAMTIMLTTNPFASHRFMQDLLINEDWDRGDNGILLPLISKDLFALQEQTPAAVAEIITRDEERLSAAEALICTDESITNVEGWYVYYLETQSSSGYPFLDMNKVANDLMDDGHFNTGSTTLDSKMDGLISEDTRNLLTKLNSEEEMGKMVSDYFTTGTSGYVVVDAMINDYLATGSTGVDAADAKIKAYLSSGAMDEMMGSMMDSYLATGTTNNAVVDGMIQKYLATGTTGNTDMDTIINDYMTSDTMKGKLEQMLTDYLKNGTTGSDVVDDLIEGYLNNGTTGNTNLDALIEQQLKSEAVKNQLKSMAMKYAMGSLTGNPTTGNPAIDALIRRYEQTGTTGITALDEMLDSYLGGGSDEPTDPTDPSEPTKPTAPTTTGHDVLDELIKRYNKNGTAGYDKLNSIFKGYDLESVGAEPENKPAEEAPEIPTKDYDYTEEQAKEMLDAYLTDGPNGTEADEIIGNILKYGTCGDKDLDLYVNNYLGTADMRAKVEALAKKYFQNGRSGIPAVDDVLDSYLLNNFDFDDNMMLYYVVAVQLDDGKFDEAIKSRLSEFPASDDNSGEGDGNEDDKDEEISINDLLNPTKLKQIVAKYQTQGTTGNASIDAVFAKYQKSGTTGNATLDTLLKNAGLKITGSSSINDALNQLLGGNKGTSSGSSSSGPKDTRVFFNAVLGYNDQLKDAELIRKGLYYGDKIDKLEVEE